jgi:hypothetical protein
MNINRNKKTTLRDEMKSHNIDSLTNDPMPFGLQDIIERPNVANQGEIMYSNSIFLLKRLFELTDITPQLPIHVSCNMAKWISYNLCNATELSVPLLMFISLMSQMVLPRDVYELTGKKIQLMYQLEKLREQEMSVRPELIEESPNTPERILRKNILSILYNIVQKYPNLNVDIIYPVCDFSKWVTNAVCTQHPYAQPFLVLMSVLAQIAVPAELYSPAREQREREYQYKKRMREAEDEEYMQRVINQQMGIDDMNGRK